MYQGHQAQTPSLRLGQFGEGAKGEPIHQHQAAIRNGRQDLARLRPGRGRGGGKAGVQGAKLNPPAQIRQATQNAAVIAVTAGGGIEITRDQGPKPPAVGPREDRRAQADNSES